MKDISARDLLGRIECLERRSRWSIVVGILTGVSLGLLLNGGFSLKAGPSTALPLVRAERFEVVNKAGTPVAVLADIPRFGTGLVISDSVGRSRMAIALSSAEDSTILLLDKAGNRRLFLIAPKESQDPNGLSVFDTKGRALLGLGVSGDKGWFQISDPSGKALTKLP